MNAPMTLDRRALNRALLARQWLLERAPRSAMEAVEHLVGLQAQAPLPPYVALWARLEGFAPTELSDLLESRQVVRMALMRSTVHLVTVDDAATLRALVQPVLARQLAGSRFGRAVAPIDPADLVAATRELLDAAPRTPAQLGAALRQRWPDPDGESLQNAARNLAPLVQLPPRGLWRRGGQATYATLETWTGHAVDPTPSIDAVVLRYLAAFGPATATDVQKWSGLTRLGEVLDRLRPQLATFADDSGRRLWDLPDAPRPDPDTPAPARLLPFFDNAILSHADRGRIFPPGWSLELAPNGTVAGPVLVDGFVSGTWSLAWSKGKRPDAIVTLRPLATWSAADRAAVEHEAAQLLSLHEVASGRVELTAAGP
jgi:Winged helix DNA-binding domain